MLTEWPVPGHAAAGGRVLPGCRRRLQGAADAARHHLTGT